MIVDLGHTQSFNGPALPYTSNHGFYTIDRQFLLLHSKEKFNSLAHTPRAERLLKQKCYLFGIVGVFYLLRTQPLLKYILIMLL